MVVYVGQPLFIVEVVDRWAAVTVDRVLGSLLPGVWPLAKPFGYVHETVERYPSAILVLMQI
jgi:hypothetical protein